MRESFSSRQICLIGLCCTKYARRIFATFRRKASDTWAHAKQHPVSSAAVTVGGLVAAGVVFWAVGHYDLVDRAMTAIGV